MCNFFQMGNCSCISRRFPLKYRQRHGDGRRQCVGASCKAFAERETRAAAGPRTASPRDRGPSFGIDFREQCGGARSRRRLSGRYSGTAFVQPFAPSLCFQRAPVGTARNSHGRIILIGFAVSPDRGAGETTNFPLSLEMRGKICII